MVRPAGVEAAAIYQLWLMMLWVTGAIFAIVLSLVFLGLRRGVRQYAARAPSPTSDARLNRTIVASVVASAVTLIALLAAS
jgi:heme/copper-type cytochrome/quinol oxidase subunit 2